MTPDYDAALFAAADRHMSRGSTATANVEMDVERDGAVFLAEVCVEEGTVSWADITHEYVEDADGKMQLVPVTRRRDVTLTDAELREAKERAQQDAEDEAEERRERMAEARADRNGDWR